MYVKDESGGWPEGGGCAERERESDVACGCRRGGEFAWEDRLLVGMETAAVVWVVRNELIYAL